MILITGANGFVGKALVQELIKEYGAAQILTYSSATIDGVQGIVHHDYSSQSFNFLSMGYENIKTIIHVGAATPKAGSEANEMAVYDKNIEVTKKLLGAKLPHLEKFIFISTLDVYDQSELINELTPLNPLTAYGKSKLNCELLIQEYSQSTSVICQVLRLGHVYGPGEEKYKKLIPEVMRKIIQDEPIQIWGTGEELRAFIYIDDVVKCILAALNLKRSIAAVNIAGARQVQVKELVALILEISRSKIKPLISGERGKDVIFDCRLRETLLLAKETPLYEGLLQEWNYMKALNW